MKAKAVLLCASVCLAGLLQSPLACAGDEAEQQVKAEYLGKTLILRRFYSGKQLKFQSDGSLAGQGDIGPWTVDGEIFVESIELGKHRLQIHARRLCLVFDSKGKPYRDVLDLLAESTGPDRDKLLGSFRANEVDIDIALRSSKPGIGEIRSSMDAVFLPVGSSIEEVVPDFWRGYFDRMSGQTQNTDGSIRPVQFAKQGISPPRATYSPNPDFSEEARMAKYQGSMTVSLVVDTTGDVKRVAIASPLGMGLDERAVATINTWKFQPALKDGQPVAVEIAVRVDFSLY